MFPTYCIPTISCEHFLFYTFYVYIKKTLLMYTLHEKNDTCKYKEKIIFLQENIVLNTLIIGFHISLKFWS